MRLPKKIPRGATLRLELVQCGRCPKDHGPYWYAYWKDYRGVTHKQYVGNACRKSLRPLDTNHRSSTLIDTAGSVSPKAY